MRPVLGLADTGADGRMKLGVDFLAGCRKHSRPKTFFVPVLIRPFPPSFSRSVYSTRVKSGRKAAVSSNLNVVCAFVSCPSIQK